MPERIINVSDSAPSEGVTGRTIILGCQNHEMHIWRIIPGEWIYPHIHPHTDDIFYIVQGYGEYYTSAENKHPVGPGELAFASPDEVHGIFNSSTEDMIILSVLAPTPVEFGEAPGFEYPE